MIATLRALLAIALLASLCLIPAGLVFAVLFLLPFLNYIATGNPAPSVYYLIPAMPGLWVLLYIVFMLLGVTGTPRDDSVVVSRDEDPGRLWNRVVSLAGKVGTRPPDELRLTAEPNAGVVEETRWLGLIPGTRRMYLGIPLLAALPDEQLDAVICHELGHYARGHTRVTLVCYRARDAALLMVKAFRTIRALRDSNRRRRVVNRVVSEVHFQVILRYAWAYCRLSEAAAHAQEFQADTRAVRAARAQTTADALRAVHAVMAGWGMFTNSKGGIHLLADSASDPFTEFRDEWKEPGNRQRAALVAREALKERERKRKARTGYRAWAAGADEHEDDDPFSTHPPLGERLERIIPGHGRDSWPDPDAPPEGASMIQLGNSDLERLFAAETDAQRKRGTPVRVSARKGRKAILSLLRSALKARPLAAAAAAVIVLGGTVSGVYEGHQHARPGGALVAALAPVPNSDLFPRGPTVSPLAVKLTDYLQSKNESGFLSLAAPSARKAMRSWWANQQAMGFTTGAVVPTGAADNSVNVDSTGNGTAVVLAGTHSPFDPADGTFIPPAVPSAEYRIGLHFSSGAGPDAVGQITSWTPLSDAPWDEGTPLTVRKSAHVQVVAGPGDSALVSQTLPLAETAAAYDLAFMSHFDPEPLNDQTGFVVFVAGSASDLNRWFRSGSQPKEQADDADDGAAYVLEGPSDGYFLDMCARFCFTGVDGGARVVITPHQQAGETPQQETGVLIGEMYQAFLMPGELKGIQPWANEGYAHLIADLYQAGGDPVSASHDLGQVIAAVRALPSSYRTGTLPGTQQLYGGTAVSRADWNTVAASVYAYIAEKYGMSDMLNSADLLGHVASTPFGNVYVLDKSGKVTYYPAPAISNGWREWLRNPR